MKGQFFSFDVMTAVTIIILIILIIGVTLYTFHPEFGKIEELEKIRMQKAASGAIDILVIHEGVPEKYNFKFNDTEECGFWKKIKSLGLTLGERYILDQEKVLYFVNSSLEPNNCICSKMLLGLTEYNYTFFIKYTNNTLLKINSTEIIKLCPSNPTLKAEVNVQKRAVLFNGKRVFVYLVVWKQG